MAKLWMNNIALNFVPLVEQNSRLAIYRTRVIDSSQSKSDGDYRANLPEFDNDEKWVRFDVSTNARKGYERYEYEYRQNSSLTLYLIFCELLETLKTNTAGLEYYVPQRAIALKEVRFITEKFNEGNTEIIVKPYYLKEKREFGFLIEHKFSLAKNQPFNRQTQIRSLSLDNSGKSNIYFYKDKRSILVNFTKTVLSPLLSETRMNFHVELSSLPSKLLDVKTYVVGGGSTVRSQFMGIKANGPYRRMKDEVRFLFLFTERTKSLARDIYLGLVGTLFPGQFPGLEEMFQIAIRKDLVDHQIVDTFDAQAMQSIEEQVLRLKSYYPNSKVMLVSVLPRGFKGVDAPYDAYAQLKLMALKHSAYCQVVTEDSFLNRDQLKWSVSNIGLQMFSKLGGAPWLVKPAKNNCLMFGLGSVQEKFNGNTTKFTAYTICLDSSGDFKYIRPLSSSHDESTYLNELQTNLKRVLSSELGDLYKSLVLHLPYKISKNEIEIIKSVSSEIREGDKFEVIVMRVNTKHKFLGFSDHNTCIPYESSYIQISRNEFLIWAEGLQRGKEVLHKRVSDPLYIEFVESPNDGSIKKDCLQDILNLTGANWRGFNSKAQPITILYSRLIARFMKEFSNLRAINDLDIVSAESDAPWFL